MATGARQVDGAPPNSTLRRHITGLEENTAARFKAAPTGGKPPLPPRIATYGHVCQQINGWKCGCADTVYAISYWQLQGITVGGSTGPVCGNNICELNEDNSNCFLPANSPVAISQAA